METQRRHALGLVRKWGTVQGSIEEAAREDATVIWKLVTLKPKVN